MADYNNDGPPSWAYPQQQQQQQQQQQHPGYRQIQQQTVPSSYVSSAHLPQQQHPYVGAAQPTNSNQYPQQQQHHHHPQYNSNTNISASSSTTTHNTTSMNMHPSASHNSHAYIHGTSSTMNNNHSVAPSIPSSSTSSKPASLPNPQNNNNDENFSPPSAASTHTMTLLDIQTPDEELEDGRIRNQEASKKITDAWIYKQIKGRVNEFTQYNKVRILIGTWNVNAKFQENTLDAWLCQNWGSNSELAPDIVAIGLQEMVDLNAVNVAVEGKTAQRSAQWKNLMLNTLNSKQYTQNDANRAYIALSTKYLVGLNLCVFVKAVHHPRVKFIKDGSVGVGVMGVMGNKGGVSVRFQFYDSTICIVNSHLAAHRENVVARNTDFMNISSKLIYEIGDTAIREAIRNGSLSHEMSGSTMVNMYEHDLVFWMGDLNYRVQDSIPTETVLKLAESGNLDYLRKNDQLNIERSAGRAFQQFREGKLNFKPTYKYQPGYDCYDTRPEKKIRAPAWCDRVLWKCSEPSDVDLISYDSCDRLCISDHKPVVASFNISVKNVIQSKREKIYDDVMKILDQYDNRSSPIIGLDRIQLNFGEVRYKQSITLPITVTNTGNVIAQYRFIPKYQEKNICKPWMVVSPLYGLLIPGQQDTINFSINLNNNVAIALNSGKEILEDIIILRLENGREYYITVKANFARSCFGMSINELVLYTDPIRDIPLDPILRAEKYGANQVPLLPVPKELYRIIDAIYQKGLQERYLFSLPGVLEEMQQIRECLDTDTPFGEFSIHSMVEVLVMFLGSLSVPVVSMKLIPTFDIDPQSLDDIVKRFLDSMEPIHYNVFVYLMSFFRECLAYSQSNSLTFQKVKKLSYEYLVLGSGQPDDGASKQRNNMAEIMQHMLDANFI